MRGDQQHSRASLITSATTTRTAEIKSRERRYLATMAVRLIAFVLAVTLFGGVARFVAIGLAVILPWLAVMAANAPQALRKGKPELFTPEQRVQTALPPSTGPVVVDADPPSRPPRPLQGRASGDAPAG